jgi:DNA-binding NarL/FixJ family response regulator
MRVVVAEDSVLLREGLVRLLADCGEDVVAAVGDAIELLKAVELARPDVAIVDIRMPPLLRDDGLQAAIEIRRRFPLTAVVVLSQYVEQAYATELLAGGSESVGYLLKERVADVGQFMESVRRVAAGGTALDPEVVAQLVARARDLDPLQRLSAREREVLGLMAEGRTNSAIAGMLVVSEGAIEKHVTSIFAKLDLAVSDRDHRRVLAVLRWLG